ncbi:hypothetical protein F5Y15DRAFT_411470 [Xylariaceae sp. FL0016]|nr:hypothetical protein F5Y15DRAFT_411470 [Xylariaceae sp. FL0016]
MPGFGSSFDPRVDPPSISWYADLYYEMFSSFPEFQHGACHIIGHHSGAVIATELAASRNGWVQSLTLVGPTIMSADERAKMKKSFLAPFNRPRSTGGHLVETWHYVADKGIAYDKTELLQRESLDHIRAWKGRSQIYACVWEYDCESRIKSIDDACKVMALCAQDDVLWPYFENVRSVGKGVLSKEIHGANFGPDLDPDGIVREFFSMDC